MSSISTMPISAMRRRHRPSFWPAAARLHRTCAAPPPVSLYALPTPAYVPVPAWVEPPAYVEPPHDNFIFRNIHNTVVNNTVVNNNTNTMTTEPGSAQAPPAPPAQAPAAPAGTPLGQKLAGTALVAGAGAAAMHVALPPSLQRKVQHLQNAGQPAAPQAAPAPLMDNKAIVQTPADTHALPGENGKALPPIANMPPLKSETRQEPPRAAAHQMAAPQPPAPEAPQRNLPANGSSRPTPDIMEVPARSADHHRPRPLDQTDAAPAPPKHQPNPQALTPRPERHAAAPQRAEDQKPHPRRKWASGRKACTCLGTQAPKAPKPPKPPKPPKKKKKCHAGHECH